MITRLLETLDRRLFRDDDLRATSRGLEVRRSRRFRRTYRDSRFDLVSSCTACDGYGVIGVHECPDCDGTGRIIARPDEPAVRS